MEEKCKESVCNSVYRQFPELRGVHPTVKSLPGDKFQFVFQGKAQAADGKSISRIVRATANEAGKILKLTTSR
jgi:hypothetical protein